MSKQGAETRKAKAIARIIEEFGYSYDEAEEHYRKSFKLLGSRGGKNGRGHTFAHGKVDPVVANEQSLAVRRGK